MFIKVLPPSRDSIPKDNKDTVFYLSQDNWNDFSFQTLYHLYLSEKYSDDGELVSIGSVKILKKGQTESDTQQVKQGELEQLDESFCSIGQSLDYYERIANIDEVLREKLLHALRDIVIHPKYKSGFENEKGWSTSLLRDIEENDDIFTLAPMLVSKQFNKIPRIDLSFDFSSKDLDIPLSFNFDSPAYGYASQEKLPGRIIVLVGRNGSGKSTLLSKISRIAFASGTDRNDKSLKQIGSFSPKGLGFSKILNISYSAFDSFQVPGIYLHEKEQIAKDISQNHGRYIFCGIRDICKELESIEGDIEVDSRGKLSENEILQDRQPYTHLKPIEQLATEFEQLVNKIISNDKEELLNKVLDILSKEASFYQLGNDNLNIIDEMNTAGFFMSLSTGHKFVLHSLVSIVAHTEPKTLILFDEPETHLHPPLLAVMMIAIRYVLDKIDAFSIVATHSPVVVQETLERHVHIVRRDGAVTKVIRPEIQTFGENIGSITSHVFGLSTDITDYHYELDNIIRNMKSPFSGITDNGDIIKSIEKLFDGNCSMQARAYIMSALIDKES